MDRNRIFIDRTRDVGVISTADALNWGFTGPILRSTGAAARPAQGHALPRLRRARLRSAGGHQGRQLRPLLRAHARDGRVGAHDPAARATCCPTGPINVDDRRCTFPDKQLVYTEIESLINHFKLVMDGPAGACRRGLLGARGAERRARLLPGEHRRRHAVQGARALRRASCTWAGCTGCSRAISSPTSSRRSARST